MKARVEFKDGITKLMELPEEMRYVAEITTGRPDRMENVQASFSHWDGSGSAVFLEKEERSAEAGVP